MTPTARRLPPALALPLLGAGTLGLAVLAAGMGFIAISPGEVLSIALGGLPGMEGLAAGADPVHQQVVWAVRLPRILAAAGVGAGLAAAGAVFQGILLNPLADPYTLGVSSGAAFGASLALWLGLDFGGTYTVCLLAFVGAALTLYAVIRLASVDGQLSPTSLILSGVIVAAILSAGIGLIKYLADEQVAVIIFWLMGSFIGKTWLEAGLVLTVGLLGVAVFLYHARDLNLLCLGVRSAESLGVPVRRVRLTLLVTASLVAAVGVAISGIIGFVGLLVPHLLRFLVGPDHRVLIPAAALGGALLLLGADTITRAWLPHEVPIGVLTAVIGGPFFCWVFRRRQLGVGRG